MFGFHSSILGGLRSYAKKNPPTHLYDELTYTPFLHSSNHLWSLYDQAGKENPDKKEIISDYMDRFKCDQIHTYAAIKDQIEKDLKIGDYEPSIPKKHMKKTSRYLNDFGGGWDDFL